MRINKVAFLLLIISLCSTSLAFGYVLGNSNFDLAGYPEFTLKHYKPSKPLVYDQYAIEMYRESVQKYVDDAKDYVKAANNDIDSINEAKKKAINEANDAVNEYNRFIQNGY